MGFRQDIRLIQNGKTSLTPEATPAPVQSYVIHEAQQKIYEDLQVLFEAGSPYTIGNAVRTHAELVDVFGANRGFYTKAKLPSKDLAKVVVRSLLNIELSMKRYKGDEVFQKIISGNAQEQKILVVS
ncbi:MAG: hypothetical protein ACPGXZ_00750 [Saprospiraceae bacterium]